MSILTFDHNNPSFLYMRKGVCAAAQPSWLCFTFCLAGNKICLYIPTTSGLSSSDSNRRRCPGHARSRSTASATLHIFLSSNICLSGQIGKQAPAAAARGMASPAVGNIQAEGVAVMARSVVVSRDSKEVRRLGDEQRGVPEQ